jgi:phenylalanyl-tRNA synthetase beta chain
MKVSFDWLKDYVQVKLTPEVTAEKLTMAGLEVKKVEMVGTDSILETEVTTNRPDWLSHIGVAREIHAITGSKFKLPETKYKSSETTSEKFEVVIPKSDLDLCPYYSACLLEGVSWNETPDFMKQRLEACQVRSINFPVDVTNFVLLEMGQPLHAFDANLLIGKTVYARRAKMGEKITAIDGLEYALEGNDLIIADEKGAIAIGGVMGGKRSEVNDKTNSILLESAFFAPSAVRKTSHRLKLASESSYRFERRVDPGAVDAARERAVYLFTKYGNVKRISKVFRAGKLPLNTKRVSLLMDELEKVLGASISKNKTGDFLSRLGMSVKNQKNGVSVSVPSFRADITQPADLIEEVARLEGYDKIQETLPEIVPAKPVKNKLLCIGEEARNLCMSLGMSECVTFSLTNPAVLESIKLKSSSENLFGLQTGSWVRLRNPQNKEWTLMRPTLLPSLLDVVRRNYYAGEKSVKLFEVANRYVKSNGDDLPKEELMIGIAVSGEARANWLERKRSAGFFDLKGRLEELLDRLGFEGKYQASNDNQSIFESEQGVRVDVDGTTVGYYGSVSQEIAKIFDIEKPVYFAEINLKALSLVEKSAKTVEELPKYPSSPRDLTLIMPDSVIAESVAARVLALGKNLIQQVEVFDVFKGGKIPADKKSVSFSVVYQSRERTLENEEVNRLHFSIVETIEREFHAESPKAQ